MKLLFRLVVYLVLALSLGFIAAEAKEKKATESEKDYALPVLCSMENAEAPILLAQTCPGQHTCITTGCGVMSGQVYCCPQGYRYLNHCDCQCYNSTDFDCNSYTRCD